VAALKAMIQGMGGNNTATSPSYSNLSGYGSTPGAAHGVSPDSPNASRLAPSPTAWNRPPGQFKDAEDGSRKRRRTEEETRGQRPLVDDRYFSKGLHYPSLPPAPYFQGCKRPQPIVFDHSDVIEELDKIIPRDISELCYSRYVREVFPRFPLLPISPPASAEELRKSKPLLYLSAVTMASYSISTNRLTTEAQAALGRLYLEQTAKYAWLNCEKSFEIVQCLQMGSLWYRPPTFEQHNFYLMANNAIAMSLELGAGKRPSSNVLKMGIGPFRKRAPDADSLEARRLFIVCYYMSVNMAMVLRRPILLRWSKYLDDCLEALVNSPQALPGDADVVYHAKLAHFIEKLVVRFKMHDPSECETMLMSDRSVVESLVDFRAELEQLRSQRPPGAVKGL
jgi:hypothetical protein